MLFLPETPRYLIKKGKPEAAAQSLAKLRRLPADHQSVVDELAEIQANHDYEVTLGSSSYMTCLKPPIRKRLFTGVLLQALQQLTYVTFVFFFSQTVLTIHSGINFIFYYGTTFFTNSGISRPFVVTMITSAVNVVSTLPGLYLVEKWGRRPLLMFGAIGMAVSQIIVAALGTALPDQQAADKGLVAFVCFYM